LAAETFRYAQRLVRRGIACAIADDAGLAAGVLVADGAIVHRSLAEQMATVERRPPLSP